MNKRITAILNGTATHDPMSMYKSAPKQKVLTEVEDKVRKKSAYEEQSLVTAYCTWFKLQYPGVPYQINSKEQKRSYAAQNVLKKQEFKPGVPDFQCDRAAGGYHTFRLEFKKSYDELFTKQGLLKPGSYGHFYEQDDYHQLLISEDHYCCFVWDLELAINLTTFYMLGEPVYISSLMRSQPDYVY